MRKAPKRRSDLPIDIQVSKFALWRGSVRGGLSASDRAGRFALLLDWEMKGAIKHALEVPQMCKAVLQHGCFEASGSNKRAEAPRPTQKPRFGGAYTAKIAMLLATFTTASRLSCQTSETISPPARLMMASRIYHVISTFFPGLPQEKFDAEYEQYLGAILRSSDRREFDLASMKLIAELHDGHSWFYDKWLEETYGQPIGFLAYPLGTKWTVVHSQLDSIHVGDVITAIDETRMQDFFTGNRVYVSASSERDAGVSFFDTPAIFPEKFTLTLSDGRKVTIDRKNDKKNPPSPAFSEGRWLLENSVAYVKVPTFRGVETQAQALQLFNQFRHAKAMILDVRGNPGEGAPNALQRSLMGRPYQSWTESTEEHGGALLRNYAPAYPTHSTVTFSDTVIPPRATAYTGRLILLTDRICSCACEDFVMPFKYSKRATLIGETTAGTFSLTRHIDYDNGMILNIAAVHHTFPDGSQFEGVGISPDVPIDVTPDDLQAGRDPVLTKALEIAQQP